MNWSIWVSPLCSLEMTCGWVLGLCCYTRAVSVWNKWTAVNKNQFSLFLFEYVINPVLCILIFQHSFPECFFPKMEKNSKKYCRNMPTFFVIRVILILDSHLLLVFQRTLHLWVCLLKPHLRKNEKKKKKKPSSYKIHFSSHTYARWADQWITLYLFFSHTTLSHHPVWFLRHHSKCPKWKAFIGFFDLGHSRK